MVGEALDRPLQFQILFAAGACPVILSNLLGAVHNRLQGSWIDHKLTEQINHLFDDLRWRSFPVSRVELVFAIGDRIRQIYQMSRARLFGRQQTGAS